MTEELLDDILKITMGISVGIAMFALIVVLYIYLRLSDNSIRTYLYTILFIPLLYSPYLAVYHGGWWWMAPPITAVLIALVKKVDDAQPNPDWKHPW